MQDTWSERAAVVVLGAVVVLCVAILAVRPSEVLGTIASTALGALAMYVRGGGKSA